MIRDRGRIKWAPFLIPEHKKRIAKMYEAEEDVRKPIIDEQRLEELQEKISEAIEFDTSLEVTYFANRRIHVVTGKVKTVDPITGSLHMLLASGQFKLPLQSILNLQIDRDVD